MQKKRSLFQRIKRVFHFEDEFFDDEENEDLPEPQTKTPPYLKKIQIEEDEDDIDDWKQQEEEVCGELGVDVYDHVDCIMIQAMVAGVKPESLEITIGRDIVVIKGKRDDTRKINDDKFLIKELYWGAFARTIILAQEIDPDLAEASEKFGLLTLKLPKIDRNKRATIKVKSI